MAKIKLRFICEKVMVVNVTRRCKLPDNVDSVLGYCEFMQKMISMTTPHHNGGGGMSGTTLHHSGGGAGISGADLHQNDCGGILHDVKPAHVGIDMSHSSTNLGSLLGSSSSSEALPSSSEALPWWDEDESIKCRLAELEGREKQLKHDQEEWQRQRGLISEKMDNARARLREMAQRENDAVLHREQLLLGRDSDIKAWEDKFLERTATSLSQNNNREIDQEIQHDDVQAPLLPGPHGSPEQAVPEPKEKKDDDSWNKSQIYASMALATGLTVLFQIYCDLDPKITFTILAPFATVWLLGAAGFVSGLDGTYGFEEWFSRHMARFIFMCLSLLVLYALYVMSLHGPSSSQLCPSSAAPSPSPAVAPSSSPWWVVWLYFILAIIVMSFHLISWWQSRKKE